MNNIQRSYEPELIDLGSSYYSQQEYEDCIRQLGRVGQLLGGDRATLHAFDKLSNLRTILDVGCGGGQFSVRLAKKFPQAKVTGIDVSKQAIEFAQKNLQTSSAQNVTFEVPSVPELTYLPNSFDVVTATLVCHHLNDAQLIDFLKRSYQVASKAVILNDLHRHWLARVSFSMVAKPLFRNRLISHDGLLSIKRAFKKEDWHAYLEAAGIPSRQYTLSWHWAFRWVVYIDTTSKAVQ